MVYRQVPFVQFGVFLLSERKDRWRSQINGGRFTYTRRRAIDNLIAHFLTHGQA